MSKCTVMAIYAWPLGEVHESVTKFRQPLRAYTSHFSIGLRLQAVSKITFNLFTNMDLILTNTCFTSQATVAGDGS
jgi:hypothetical protein